MNVTLFLIVLPVLLMSVVVHEVAHALVAKWEGDETAYRLGRVTLNPIPHLDLMGSLIVPLLLFFLPGDFIFGWAKPVPVNPRNYRDYKWGDIRVSMAGIVSNLILAVLCTLFLALLQGIGSNLGSFGGVISVLSQAAFYGLYINLILAVFNLIPIPPLDGSHVLYHLLPSGLRARYREFGRYGIAVIMLLVFVVPDGFGMVLRPVTFLVDLALAFVAIWV
ncbi:MAG: site-2 protease family protein [Longimicrobiales bacterium]|nr:site-2 protease family protein [Longimicrobiales bacterium]